MARFPRPAKSLQAASEPKLHAAGDDQRIDVQRIVVRAFFPCLVQDVFAVEEEREAVAEVDVQSWKDSVKSAPRRW